MSNAKSNKTPQLGLQRHFGNMDIHKVQRLGNTSNNLTNEYNDSFTFFEPINIKLLINHLRTDFLKTNKFNSEKYIDHEAIAKKEKEAFIEKITIKKDKIQGKQIKIFSKPDTDKDQLERNIEDNYYNFLSKSISLNTTISYIDNNYERNGYTVNFEKKNGVINYTYSIYYKASDEVIKRSEKKIETTDQYRAIIIKTAGVETLFFFLEKVYGVDPANNLRYNIYNKFKEELEKTSDIETLAFIYKNLPDYIKRGYNDEADIESKPYKLPDELLWKHLQMFVNYDKGLSDASYYVLNTITLITPKFCMEQFLQDQSFVIDIYNGLDDGTLFDLYPLSETFSIDVSTFEPSNKDFFISLLYSYIQLYENDPKITIFESSGAHFYQGIKKGGKYDPEINFRLDSNILFSDDKKNKVYIKNNWEGKRYLGQEWDSQGKIRNKFESGRGINESGYYNPLDVVKFTQYNDKGEAIEMNVPAIFVKYASDVKEWEKVNEGVRLGTNILMLVLGPAALISSVGSLMLYAAIVDIGLAYTDIIVQGEKENLKRSAEGKAFLENWEKIYTVGSVATFSPIAIKAVATYGPKMLKSGARLLQVPGKIITNPEVYKKIKDLTTKAIYSIEIPNFNKTGLEILKIGIKEFAELKNAEKLQKLGVIFVKGAEDTVAAIYKGNVIASDAEKGVARRLFKPLNKLVGNQLKKYLDDLFKWKNFKSLIGTGGLIKYKKILSRNMVGQEKGMACAAACIEQLTIDYNIAKKYSQFDIFDLIDAGIESGMKNAQIEDAMVEIFGRSKVMSAGYGSSYSGIEVFKDIARYVDRNGGTWIAIVREETRHAILIDKIVENSVYIRDPWPLEGLKGIESGKPGVEAILDLDYFAKIWEQTGGIMLRVK